MSGQSPGVVAPAQEEEEALLVLVATEARQDAVVLELVAEHMSQRCLVDVCEGYGGWQGTALVAYLLPSM